MIDQEQVLEILHAIGEKITEEKLYLTELDNVIGEYNSLSPGQNDICVYAIRFRLFCSDSSDLNFHILTSIEANA